MLEIANIEHCPACGLSGCDYLIINNQIIIHIPLFENKHRIEKVIVTPGKAKFRVKE